MTTSAESPAANSRRLREFLRNAAGSLDVIAIEVGAHGCTSAHARLAAIADMLRERAKRRYGEVLRADFRDIEIARLRAEVERLTARAALT